MRVSEHANYLLNEYGRLQFDYAAFCKPDGESLRNEARNNLETYIAELEEQVWNLNLENERLEEAYWIDETISPDGTLKPSVRKLLERLEKAETDLRLSDDLVKALDNRIAELETEKECEMRVFKDGNAWYFVLPDFQDLQVASSFWMRDGVLDKIYRGLRSFKNERQSANND